MLEVAESGGSVYRKYDNKHGESLELLVSDDGEPVFMRVFTRRGMREYVWFEEAWEKTRIIDVVDEDTSGVVQATWIYRGNKIVTQY